MAMDCTCSALRMAARRLTQAYDAALSPQGLTTAQYALLSRLAGWAEDDGPTVQRLADRLGVDRTTLAHNLRPLERDGLVAVACDTRDRRIRRVSLTIRGRARREACFPLWRAAQEKFGRTFGPQRTADLMAALASIVSLEPLRETHHAG